MTIRKKKPLPFITDRQASSPAVSHATRNTQHAIRTHPGLLLALLAYLILAFSYFFIVPIFEAPDEWTHTGHVKYIAQGNGLPVMLPGQGIWGGQQPPLYYAIGALLVQPFDLSNFEEYLEQQKNPHASLGYALDPGNKNNYLHHPNEKFPYRGLSLAVHVLRLYSMMFGLITVIFTYLTAYEFISGSEFRVQSSETRSSLIIHHSSLFPTIVALFVACQPMFNFITASAHNEPANIAFSAIGLWLAQRYVLFGPGPNTWKRAATLGVTLGLISLSKMTGLSFVLVVVVGLLYSSVTTRKQPGAALHLWRDSILIGLAFLLVGGWWYWRNYQLYGDFFQQGLYKIYFNQVPQPLSLSGFLHHLATGEVSFWAVFGWLNVAAPEWVYSAYRIISRVGLLGVALAALFHRMKDEGPRSGTNTHKGIGDERQMDASRNTQYATRPQLKTLNSEPETRNLELRTQNSKLLTIHLIFPITLAFSLTRLVALEGGLQGRQLLPALGSIAIVIIWGWWALTPARIRRPVLGLLAAVMFGLALWLPYTVVADAYIPRPPLTEAELPANLTRLNWSYNNEMKLIGVEVGADQVRPGQRLPVTAYWQALKPMTTNYSVFVHLVGRNHQTVGQFNTYPGLGLRPTRTLQPGQIVVDTYPVLVHVDSQAPARLRVNVGLFNFNEAGRPGIQATGPNGNPVGPTVGQLKLAPAKWPPIPDTPPIAKFAGNIWLADYTTTGCRSTESNCTLTLKWLARGRPAADYTVFVQLWQNGQQIAGFDAPPLDNDYPTSLWDAQEVIVDPHALDLSALPAGRYQIVTGLYNFATGQRLPATTATDTPLPDNAVQLDTISITP